MKSGVHPEYNAVVFHDVSSDYKLLTRSTLTSDDKIEWEDGNTYPLVKVEISSASHSFYTGKQQQIAERGGRSPQILGTLAGIPNRHALGAVQQDHDTVIDATIEIDGEMVRIDSPRSGRELGIGMVYQHLSLIPTLTVLENLIIYGRYFDLSYAAAGERPIVDKAANA